MSHNFDNGGVSTISDGIYADRPAAGDFGKLYLPTDGFQQWFDDGVQWQAWGPIFPLVDPIQQELTWAWNNQDTATVDDNQGGIFVSIDGSSGNSEWHTYEVATDAEFQLTIGFVPLLQGRSTDTAACGLITRESMSDHRNIFYIAETNQPLSLQANQWSDAATFAGSVFSQRAPRDLRFLRVLVVGGTTTFSWSADGQNFAIIGTDTYVAPDRAGIAIFGDGTAGIATGINLIHWEYIALGGG